jgi:opacity protein-like surface antigen
MHLIKLFALVTAMAVVAVAPANAAKKEKHKKYTSTAAARTAQGQYRGTDKFPAGPLYYNGGEYLGDDPDPNIRFQLWRDLGSHFGGEN